MYPYVYVVFICLYVQIFFADCSSKFVHNDTESDTTVRADKFISTEELCSSNRCLRKCCRPGQIYEWKKKRCLPSQKDEDDNEWFSRFSKFEVIYDFRCRGKSSVVNDSGNYDQYQIFDNGSMYVDSFEDKYKFFEYCIDRLLEDDEIRPVICLNEDLLNNAINKINAEKTKFLFYSIGLGISDAFLVITLVLYLVTPKLRKKVHDKCFLCHVVTLLLGFTSLIAIQHTGIDNPACAFLGYTTQFWLLASFFWLNIMCIDMWRTVDVNQRHKEWSNASKMTIYCLYAWGCPLLISALSLIADNFLPPNHPMRIGFAEESCWFKHNRGTQSWVDPRYIYFYSFICVTLLINIYTFVDTALIIKSQDKIWNGDKNAESKRHNIENTRFFLYFKLFLVMGLNWMMEIISYHSNGNEGIWIITDILNTLQGVFIFIVFICNKRVLVILRNRFFPKNEYSSQFNRTSTDRHHKTFKVSITESTSVTNISFIRNNDAHM